MPHSRHKEPVYLTALTFRIGRTPHSKVNIPKMTQEARSFLFLQGPMARSLTALANI